MVLSWTVLFLVIILVCSRSVELVGNDDYVIGYQIQGATFGTANDVYICADQTGIISSVCTGIYHRLVISSAHVMVNDTAQKRWFIASMDEKNGTIPLYLYGAIELSSTPWLLKTWKRIGGDWEHNLIITAIHSSTCEFMVKNSSKTTKEMVSSATTIFWMMLSYSSASSLFTTTTHDKTMISTRYNTPIGQCVYLFQQYKHSSLVQCDDQSVSKNPESFSSHTIPNVGEDTKPSDVVFSVEIAYCDWLAFVGSTLSMGCYERLWILLSSSITSSQPLHQPINTDHLHPTLDHHHILHDESSMDALADGYDIISMADPSLVLTPLLCHREPPVYIQLDHHPAIDLFSSSSQTPYQCYRQYVKLTLSGLYLADMKILSALKLLKRNHQNARHEPQHTLGRSLEILARFMLHGEYHVVYEEPAQEGIHKATSMAPDMVSLSPSPLEDVRAACKMLEKTHYYQVPLFSFQSSSSSSSSSSGSPLSEHPIREGLWKRLCYFITQSSTTTTQISSQIPRSPSQIAPLSFAQSLSLLTSALAVGAEEAAVSLAVGAARRRISLPVDQDMLDTNPSHKDLLTTLLDVLAHVQNQSKAQSNDQSSAQSNNLGDEWIALSSRQQSENLHDALCVLLHTMLETANPVIITSQIPSQNVSVWTDWQEGVLQSQRDVITALDAVITYCHLAQSNSQSNCLVFDSRSVLASHGARGLFLLAYQGMSLAQTLSLSQSNSQSNLQSSELTSILKDWNIPYKYHTLVYESNPHWPWSLSQTNHNPPNTTTTTTTTNNNNNIINNNNHNNHKNSSLLRKKIGFFSSFFYRHPVGRLLGEIIVRLVAIKEFEIYVLTTLPTPVSPSSINHYHHHHHHHNNNNHHHRHSNDKTDDITSTIFSALESNSHYLTIPKDPLLAVEQVRQLSLDVIVFGDVFMDAQTLFVAMLRMAPVQVVFWGHPYTTGFPTIDYFISSTQYEPYHDMVRMQTRQDHFLEQLVVFDSLTFRMRKEVNDEVGEEKMLEVDGGVDGDGGDDNDDEVEGGREGGQWLDALHLMFSHGYSVHGDHYDPSLVPSLFGKDIWMKQKDKSLLRLYSCQQSLMKMHPLLDHAIVKILALDPHALIVLSRTPRQYIWQAKLQSRLLQTIQTGQKSSSSSSSSPWELRVIFVDQMPHTAYHSLVCAAHVILDPFPFGGGVTLSDSLTCPRTRAKDKSSTGMKTRTRTWALTPPSFVTAPALQTVHALGHGLASALSLTQRDPQDGQHHHGGEDNQDGVLDHDRWDDGKRKTTDRKTSSALLPISIPYFHDMHSDVQDNTEDKTAGILCAQSNLSAPVKSPSQKDVMEMIDAYAEAAVQLANQTWNQRQKYDANLSETKKNNSKNDFDSTSVGHQVSPSTKRRNIMRKQLEFENVLYDVNDEVIHEWISFLRRI